MKNYEDSNLVIGRDLSDDNLYWYDKNTEQKLSEIPISNPVFNNTVWTVRLGVGTYVTDDGEITVAIPVPEIDSVWLENLFEVADRIAYDNGLDFTGRIDADYGYEMSWPSGNYFCEYSIWWEDNACDYSISICQHQPNKKEISGSVLMYDYYVETHEN